MIHDHEMTEQGATSTRTQARMRMRASMPNIFENVNVPQLAEREERKEEKTRKDIRLTAGQHQAQNRTGEADMPAFGLRTASAP